MEIAQRAAAGESLYEAMSCVIKFNLARRVMLNVVHMVCVFLRSKENS